MDGLKKYSSSGMKKKETFWFVEEKGLKKVWSLSNYR